MNETTKIKLNILKDKQVISETSFEKVAQMSEFLLHKIPSIIEHDTEAMYVHLAMVLDRVEKDKQLDESNALIDEQVKASPYYDEAQTLLQDIATKIDVSFSDAECTMILLHFCTLIAKRGA